MCTKKILPHAIVTSVFASFIVWVGCVDNTGVGPDRVSYTLSASANPSSGGHVERNPVQAKYDAETVVTLMALPNEGYIFKGWSGAGVPASTSEHVAVIMDHDVALTANFQAAFTDPRDGRTYKVAKIGGATWMAENLSYEADAAGTANSWCYGGDASNCAAYGRLYNWDAATTACPAGWHLPGRDEWQGLMAAIGGKGNLELEIVGGGGGAHVVDSVYYYGYVGTSLKSKSGWKLEGYDVPGTDDYGFSALPGGYRDIDGRFGLAGTLGFWWSASVTGKEHAYYWYMYRYNENVFETKHDKSYGLSVRCVLD